MTKAEINKRYRNNQKAKGLCIHCPEKIFQSLFCKYHFEKQKEKAKIRDQKIKLECINTYGGQCICCKENKIGFLTIDHKLRGGNKHRILLFGHNVGGKIMYRWLKTNNYPSDFQVLCMNCNFATRYGKICPHMEEC